MALTVEVIMSAVKAFADIDDQSVKFHWKITGTWVWPTAAANQPLTL